MKKTGVSVSCPTCRKVTHIGAGGVLKLPVSFLNTRDIPTLCGNCETNSATWKCLQCSPDCQYLCESCREVHVQMKAFRSHIVQDLRINPGKTDTKTIQYAVCKVHSVAFTKLLDMCCMDCGVLACMSCAVFEHSGHRVVTVAEARKLESTNLFKEMEVIIHGLEESRSVLKEIRTAMITLDSEKDTIAQKIQMLFNGLLTAVQERERRVKAEGDLLLQRKQLEVGVQTEALGRALRARQHISDLAANVLILPNEQVSTYAWERDSVFMGWMVLK
jgi:hypothetical protein